MTISLHEKYVQRCKKLYVSSFACFSFTEMNNQTVFLSGRTYLKKRGYFHPLHPQETQPLLMRTIYFKCLYPYMTKRARVFFDDKLPNHFDLSNFFQNC